MNKWKIAFWCCFFMLLLTTCFYIYSILDQSVTLNYQKEGYTDTQNDLNQLIEIINKTDLSKEKIRVQLKNHDLYDFMNFKTDTVSLNQISLIFENGKLRKIRTN